MTEGLQAYISGAGPHAHRTWGMGRHPKKPLRICANLNSKSFGDFATSLLFVNTVAAHFDHAHVTVIYKDDMPFKRDLLRLANVDRAVGSGMYLPGMESLNYSDGMVGEFAHTDLFITHKMALCGALWTFDRIAWLRVPEDDAASHTARLESMGLDRGQWFATIHAREPGYLGKLPGPNLRDSDPATFEQAAWRILALGGQVVRLGHPGGTRPIMPGLVDVRHESAAVQCFAMSRARFQISSSSGPQSVADCFHTPNGCVDETDHYERFNDRMVVRTVDFHTPHGVFHNDALAQRGWDKHAMQTAMRAEPTQYRIERNSPAEVCRMVDFMYARTDGGWREPDPVDTSPRPNQITWPAMPKPRGIWQPELP